MCLSAVPDRVYTFGIFGSSPVTWLLVMVVFQVILKIWRSTGKRLHECSVCLVLHIRIQNVQALLRVHVDVQERQALCLCRGPGSVSFPSYPCRVEVTYIAITTVQGRLNDVDQYLGVPW